MDGHFAGITCQHCRTDWHSDVVFHRLCSHCDKQFPEHLLSLRLRNLPFAADEIDPNSATGILALGNSSTAITTAAAALVVGYLQHGC